MKDYTIPAEYQPRTKSSLAPLAVALITCALAMAALTAWTTSLHDDIEALDARLDACNAQLKDINILAGSAYEMAMPKIEITSDDLTK